MKPNDLSGNRYGKLLVVSLERIGPRSYLCQCDCGKTSIAKSNDLVSGKTKSCGCGRGKPPGFSVAHGKRSRLNRIWKQMRQRCNNVNDCAYGRYGGRGIKVCIEWDDFKAFRLWALDNGYDHGLSIDRIDNNLGYSPQNCRWVTNLVQARNKRNNHIMTMGGESLSLPEWAERLGMNIGTLKSRVNILKWNDHKALTTPVRGIKCKNR